MVRVRRALVRARTRTHAHTRIHGPQDELRRRNTCPYRLYSIYPIVIY